MIETTLSALQEISDAGYLTDKEKERLNSRRRFFFRGLEIKGEVYHDEFEVDDILYQGVSIIDVLYDVLDNESYVKLLEQFEKHYFSMGV